MKISVVLGLFTLLAVFLAGSGCISVLSPVGTGSEIGSSPLRVQYVGQDSDWSLSRGCTWEATFQVSNTGNETLQNVFLTIELINANSGVVRDSRLIAIGILTPGTSRDVTASLDGECINEYTVRAVPSFDR